ncbi:hypothetical protein L596_030363 [Steinernema carpocapsae]|uniref:NNMT/PNMT/TEMT family protein n=1 Tax=Steinernema carpocapsae TaxID=34508 RepID=A0A4U5LP83_STECR|nr:hypothetical protein L596_030363 [Steinernema carpocapsae]
MATLSSCPSTETEYSEDDPMEVSEASELENHPIQSVKVYGPKDYKEKFNPDDYLNFYYSNDAMPQGARVSLFVLPIFAHIMEETMAPDERFSMIDIGAGPTIYSAVCFRKLVRRIYLTDYVQSNLDVLDHWLKKTKPFDWSRVITVVKRNEGGKAPNEFEIAKIEALARQKVNRGGIFHADVHQEKVCPFEAMSNREYDIMVSIFCLEAACSNYEEYRQAMKNMTNLLRPGGRLILGSVTEDSCYVAGMRSQQNPVVFSLLHLTEQEIVDCLEECDFDMETMRKYALNHEGVLYLMVSKRPRPKLTYTPGRFIRLS